MKVILTVLLCFSFMLIFVQESQAYVNVYKEYEITEERIIQHEENIAKIETQIFESQKEVTELMEYQYRNGKTNSELLFNSLSAGKGFIESIAYVQKIVEDKNMLTAQLQQEQDSWIDARKQLEIDLDKWQKEIAKWEDRLHFPVVGNYWYIDSWGYPRDGGRRRHKGTDIMAKTGTLCVATTSGTVVKKQGGNAGLYIKLVGDNGWTYYYMHLNSYLVPNGKVLAGQAIGTVGYSGNASRSAPHLHFEVHPPGKGAVNPYPYVRAMEDY